MRSGSPSFPGSPINGHIESYNERLANLMVTGIKDYFPTPLG